MISSTIARMLIREHLYRPITGNILTLGRQTIAMTYEDAIEVMMQEGFSPSQNISEKINVVCDQNTRFGKGSNFISDNSFFQLIGINKVSSMDVTSYEGADIIHNLNYPIPTSLYGQYDFIIDGGTFDHLFDLRVAFENVVKLLKPDGRILQWNAASNYTGAAYLSLGPDFFHDYYVLNKFNDCKVYVVKIDSMDQLDKWDFYEFDGSVNYGHFMSHNLQLSFVIAEKSSASTWDKMPVQIQYRDDLLNSEFNMNLKIMSKSKRNYFSNNSRDKFSREEARTVKTTILDIIYRTPKKWKELVPVNIKRMIKNNLREKCGKGFTHVGRI